MGSGDELDPCVCMASTLPTELSSQPCVLNFGVAQTALEQRVPDCKDSEVPIGWKLCGCSSGAEVAVQVRMGRKVTINTS